MNSAAPWDLSSPAAIRHKHKTAQQTISAPLVTDLPVFSSSSSAPQRRSTQQPVQTGTGLRFLLPCWEQMSPHQGQSPKHDKPQRCSRPQSVGKKKYKEIKKGLQTKREYISQRSNIFSQLNQDSELNMLSSTTSYSQAQQLYSLHLASPTPKGKRKKKP